MNDTTKLPKWAQERIADLERQRNEAVRLLNKHLDEQTPSPISIRELPCTGEDRGPTYKIRYVQTRRLDIKFAGIELEVFLADKQDSQRSHGIHLQWNAENHAIGRVCMTPKSFQAIELTRV